MTETAAAILLMHIALLVWGAFRQTPNLMEVGGLPAGLRHWTQGQFDIARVNPPLVRMIAALPVLAARPVTDWTNCQTDSELRGEFRVGADFLAANGRRSLWLFTLGRWACIPFSLIGAYVCFRWAAHLYGPPAGLLALILWCFSPDVLGLGQFLNPDIPAAALGAAACYTFWLWLHRPCWRTAVAAGLVLGLAQLTKGTLLVLFILQPILWWRLRDRRAGGSSTLNQRVQLAAILLLALSVLNGGYAFSGTFQSLGTYRFVSELLRGPHPSGRYGNRFAGTWLGELPVPFPRDYLLGLDVQKQDFENPDGEKRSYFRGRWRNHGWWQYYVYGMAIKMPLGTWLLFLAAALARRHNRNELALFIPLLGIVLLVSSQTGFNWHFRYVIPALPFALIFASQSATLLSTTKPKLWAFVIAASGWSVASSLAVYPHSLSYFNELVGGPMNGHAHIIGSSVDWGQDLIYLEEWVENHPDVHSLRVAYSGPVSPELLGLPPEQPPIGPDVLIGTIRNPESVGPQAGWFAVSVECLRRPGLSYFQQFKPVATAGYSIYIYCITTEEANRVRANMDFLISRHRASSLLRRSRPDRHQTGFRRRNVFAFYLMRAGSHRS